MEPDYKQALLAFGNYHPDLPIAEQGFDEFTVTPLSGGLINQTYKVEPRLSASFILQLINKNVFPRPEDVQQNYIHIWQYAEFEFTGLHLPCPMYHTSSQSLFVDDMQQYWRAMEFIGESKMMHSAAKPSEAKATAMAFAKFTAAYSDFNTALLKEVIPDFHNLSFRYKQFEESLTTDLYERMAKAMPLIEQLKRRQRYRYFFDEITGSGKFPKRVMHHDAKIANILFNNKTGKVICPIDYDTVMPGYFFSDLGDMIRSMAGSHNEDSNADALRIRKDYYVSVIDGYTGLMNNLFTDAEKKYIHSAGLIMIYMQALRFITDYLNGDIYYKIIYPEQNFDRALNQLTLLQRLEEFLKNDYNFKI